MAEIDRNQLLQDLLEIMPQGNQLSDSIMLRLAETVIATVGDDTENYPEILCKSLRACGIQNMAKASVDGNGAGRGIKKDRTYDVELEYHSLDSKGFWREWVNMLYSDVCPLFGYNHSSTSTPQPITLVKSEQPALVITDCFGNKRTMS